MRIELKEKDPFLIDRRLMYCYMLSLSEFKTDLKDSEKSDERWLSPSSRRKLSETSSTSKRGCKRLKKGSRQVSMSL